MKSYFYIIRVVQIEKEQKMSLDDTLAPIK